MSTPGNNIDREALRAEIQAAIAAGRELDPAMDEHLADSVLDRYQEEVSKPRQVAPVPPVQPPTGLSGGEVALRIASMAAGTGVLVAMVFTGHWEFFWLLFIFGGMFGWSGHGRWGRYGHSYADPALEQQYHDARRRYKINRLETKSAILKNIRDQKTERKITRLESRIERLKAGYDDDDEED
jgi:hypothetical protein